MSDALFNMMDLELLQPDRLPGSRLQGLEVFNWGTFDRHVWHFDVGGRNALLTGDIGSGKSTLVDAVTTLLLPAHKISYNRAAGADVRERDLRSYVEGFYKAERNEATGASRAVGLRDGRHFSVVLGIFANVDFDTTVTLAQVFRTRDSGQPDRFFVVADSELSITADFSDFGADLAALKRRLRDAGARVYDTFPDYGKDFRRRLGIESEQAMELFHQTVSMKAVDNLTDFVRSHMLEPFDAKAQIDALVDHFENLTRAYEAVVRARRQLELLNPMVELLGQYDELVAHLDATARQMEAVHFHFARIATGLYGARLEELDAELASTGRELAALDTELAGLREKEAQLRVDIAGNGGDRLSAIDQEIARLEADKTPRRSRQRRFNDLLGGAGMEEVTSAVGFANAKERVRTRRRQLEDDQSQAQNRRIDAEMEKRALNTQAEEVNAELRSLQSQTSNIPAASLQLRAELCSELEIDNDGLPFAGELIQVRTGAADWEGAAERVLHSFALSLLVPSTHYDAIARWVNGRHLGTRLVYYRVPPAPGRAPVPDRRGGHPLLVDMLEIKPGSGFGGWLEAELGRRANHACVGTIEELRDAPKALTRAGQIKDRDRHEKDDRRRIGERRNYVLGWDNRPKIQAMVAEATALQEQQSKVAAVLRTCGEEVADVSKQLSSLSGLDEYQTWEELDWEGLVNQIAGLRAEQERILSGSDRLKALQQELEEVREAIGGAEEGAKKLERRRGGMQAERDGARSALEKAERTLADPGVATIAEPTWSELDTAIAGELGEAAIGIGNLVEIEQATMASLDRDRSRASSRQNGIGQRLVAAMTEFRSMYPQETSEFDASLASAGEFRALQERLAGDDLPRFEEEFKDYLNQNTIRDIASFAAQLNKQEKLISERIEVINRSLVDIDYDDGRYITLVAEPTPNIDVRDFRTDLRACTDDVIGPSEDAQYSEHKFLQVKRIIDRFQGREGYSDVDRAWTRRVTDVRQWFMFSASERWREDDAEYEHYTDSAGKSGGQKEKLAYTILAASLAYQFKLDWGAARSKSFRFVVIDEAFGRGSEMSTQYALSLFTRLGLQLLIVTPLQKIHVIEPFVSAVGFVDNPVGNYSRLQTLSITEFKQRRESLGSGSAP